MHDVKDFSIPADPCGDEVEAAPIGEEELHAHIAEVTHRVSEKHEDTDNDLILVAVLKGIVFFLTDFARQLSIPSQVEFMAVSSCGDSALSSGIVCILKDLDRDIEEYDVVVVGDVINSGLTLSWLVKNLHDRNPHSLEVVTLLRKPEAVRTSLGVADVGLDIPNEFVIGYGLDCAERYRDLPYVDTLHPCVYQG